MKKSEYLNIEYFMNKKAFS